MFKKIVKKVLSKNPSLNTKFHTWKHESKYKQDFSKNTKEEKALLTQVQENGFAVLSNYFDEDYCKKCRDDIDWMLENKKEFLREDSDFDLRIFGAENLSENIKKFAEDDFFTNLANSYNATETVNAFTLGARIEFHGQEFGSGGSWHRDSTLRQFKSIVYLSDVNENQGPFQLVSRSHKLSEILEDEKTANLDSMESRFDTKTVEKILTREPERLKTLTGKAGTVIIVDTSCIHRGLPLKQGVRYALTNYYMAKTQINPQLVSHFAPLVSPETVLQKAKN